jgi:hypothetical protein
MMAKLVFKKCDTKEDGESSSDWNISPPIEYVRHINVLLEFVAIGVII